MNNETKAPEATEATKGKPGRKPGVETRLNKIEGILDDLMKLAEAKDHSQDQPKEGSHAYADRITALEERVERLTKALEQFATMAGYGNYLRQHDLTAWKPERKDMHRHG